MGPHIGRECDQLHGSRERVADKSRLQGGGAPCSRVRAARPKPSLQTLLPCAPEGWGSQLVAPGTHPSR